MKKKLGTKLVLNKRTIAVLNCNEMNSLLARARGKANELTIVERTCLTDVKCCPTPTDDDNDDQG